MRISFLHQFTALATVLLTHLSPYNFAIAADFEQQEVDQALFIAIARPYGNNQYDLLIINQIPQKRQCWSESGDKPVTVDPLLLNFDFTGSCERSTDSNGYSIRVDGQDYGLNYLLRIVQRNGELLLIGTNRQDPYNQEIVIGRTYGIKDGFLKIFLNPGWHFAKRSYQGKILGHVYLTGDSQAMLPAEDSATTASNLSSSSDNSQDNPILSSESPSEFTFTAESSGISDVEENNSLNQVPAYESSPITTNNTDLVQEGAKSNSSDLPPPPIAPSSLPPIPPPSENPNSQIVPPPSLNSTDSQRQSLSDVLTNFNGNSNPPSSTPSTTSIAQGRGYKVLVEAKTDEQLNKVRSLYPDAFRTNHNGKSFLQVGVFSTSDNAQTVLQTLKNAGLNGTMISY